MSLPAGKENTMKKRISILLILALCLSLAVGGTVAAAADRNNGAQTQAETDVTAPAASP